MSIPLISLFVLIFMPSSQSCGLQVKETFGFLDIRPDAGMFYWLMRSDGNETHDYRSKPLIIYLAGGPGDGSSGISNFGEIGPLDLSGRTRDETWLKHANLLFLDAPVGAGFSFVRPNGTFSENSSMIAQDLVAAIKLFLQMHPEFEAIPCFIFGESYGARHALVTANEVHRQVQQGRLNMRVKAVALASPWIDPLISTKASSDALHAFSMIDEWEKEKLDADIGRFGDALESGNETAAHKIMNQLLNFCHERTFETNPDNVILNLPRNKFYPPIDVFMDQPDIRRKLNLPDNINYYWQKMEVHKVLNLDSVRSLRHEVEYTLNHTDIRVIVYGGQLDLNVPMLGTQQWVAALNWAGKQEFRRAKKSLFVSDEGSEARLTSKVFQKEHANLTMFSFMNAGHFIPMDQPAAAFKMMQHIIAL